MSHHISQTKTTELLQKAIAINRSLQSASESPQPTAKANLRQIGVQLQNYTHPINYDAIPVAKIPLKVRRCFVKTVMLLTRYPQLGGNTGGTYKSPIVSTYKPDPIPDFWYETDTVAALCQWFQLSPQYVRQIEHLLAQVDRQIARQQQIMQALITRFNGVSRPKDVLNLFQNLFGNVPLPEASIDCLTTKMQIALIVDYQKERLQNCDLWQNLSIEKQQSISAFLQEISQFSWQQFARFPSFGYVKASQINSQLICHLMKVTGYSEAEIVEAIASSITILAKKRAESFLLHDIWGHYWQSILTQFKDDYVYLSQTDKDLNLDLQQLFDLKNNTVELNESLAKQFFQSTTKKRIDSLSTHLIGEILADINEYKWFSENINSQEMLLSSSCFADFPTKLDLTIQDLDFLYLPLFRSLIELPQSDLKSNLIKKFQIKDRTTLSSLQKALAKLDRLYLTKHIKQQPQFNKLILDLLKLQNILNRLYTLPNKQKDLPFRDLIIIFVGNYYSDCDRATARVPRDRNITNLNLVLAKYFFPCWLLLKDFNRPTPDTTP